MNDTGIQLLSSVLQLALWAFIIRTAVGTWQWSRRQNPGYREHSSFELRWKGMRPFVHFSHDCEQTPATGQTVINKAVREFPTQAGVAALQPKQESCATQPSLIGLDPARRAQTAWQAKDLSEANDPADPRWLKAAG